MAYPDIHWVNILPQSLKKFLHVDKVHILLVLYFLLFLIWTCRFRIYSQLFLVPKLTLSKISWKFICSILNNPASRQTLTTALHACFADVIIKEHKQQCCGSCEKWDNIAYSYVSWLWSPYVIGQTIIFSCCGLFFFLLLLSFFSSPNLSGRRLDVHHTLAHGVALVRI